MKTRIASYVPAFSGRPVSHAPGVIGCSPEKPFLYRIPVTGELPLTFQSAEPLPEGLTLDRDKGILLGSMKAGEYPVSITIINSQGQAVCKTKLVCAPDNARLTPLLGWTSWNAFRNRIDQETILKTAKQLVSTGLASYGYQYVNIDSGWQGVYDEESQAIQPHGGFPHMGALLEQIHALGLRAGIYSTPMLRAWGGGDYPGCTRGVMDKSSIKTDYGIGEDHCEAQNVAQWERWGFDYLKYDWKPCDVPNALRMKQALLESKREFAYCVTVGAAMEDVEFWRNNCNSWRDNVDSLDKWDNVLLRFTEDRWATHIRPGHYFDLDMLEIGVYDGHVCNLTPDEQVSAMSIRALFPAPIQISCDLNRLTPTDMAILCNDEILAVNQDQSAEGILCADEHFTHGVDRKERIHTKIYTRPLSDGTLVAAFFNLGEQEATATLELDGSYSLRDLWAKTDLPPSAEHLTFSLAPHCCRVVKLTPKALSPAS